MFKRRKARQHQTRSPLLQVTVNSPEAIEWEGTAEAVSSENADGPFDILPEHSNFITMIEKKPIIVHNSERDQTFTYESAVLVVQNNKVTIYIKI